LETIALPIPEFLADKQTQTDRHTQKAPFGAAIEVNRVLTFGMVWVSGEAMQQVLLANLMSGTEFIYHPSLNHSYRSWE